MPSSRFELKYSVPISLHAHVRALLRSRFVPDEHGAGADGSYRVVSLYWDSINFRTYHDKQAGVPVRFKARVRKYYPRGTNQPLNFEIKWRRGDKIWKNREQVVVSYGAKSAQALELAPHYAEFVNYHRLHPVLIIAYKRFAYRDVNSDARITFDQEICFGITPKNVITQGQLLTRDAVLEVKTNEHNLKPWIESMIAQLRGKRRTFSKYCLSVEADARSGQHMTKCNGPAKYDLMDAFIQPDFI